MIVPRSYVIEDENGLWRVGERGVPLDSIVHAYLQGHSAEAIQDQYSALNLEEVYGAIACYLANREVIDQYLERQEERWSRESRQSEQTPSPVVERLRSIKRNRSGLKA